MGIYRKCNPGHMGIYGKNIENIDNYGKNIETMENYGKNVDGLRGATAWCDCVLDSVLDSVLDGLRP